tara:strand:- start:407 stop:973 length:567 start_codon:yes stop_codon:yes gene_type:complete
MDGEEGAGQDADAVKYLHVAQACRSYLRRNLGKKNSAAQSVYNLDPEAFGIFIRTGGNLPLYGHLVDMLGAQWELIVQSSQESTTLRILDVGAGDGRVLRPLVQDHLTSFTPDQVNVHVDVVEPAEAMLQKCVEGLSSSRVHVESFSIGVEAFSELERSKTVERYDIVQATFSMNAIPREQRNEIVLP